MSIFTTAEAATGFMLGFYFVTLMWLQRDLRLTLSGKVRVLLFIAFGILPLAAVGIFWSATALAVALLTAFVIGALAFVCYDAHVRGLQGIPSPRWLSLL